ncbi:MAG: prepilin-type N-terminal cleavage/methylation domain-containing protein [Ruminococcaceae bacterium]|nr:prepilin-type N-terminal cleavage/methylation domain-containing protein [Oscillospiraceae bacterium]
MKSNKGFSLVELIVVIAIMAIIAGVAIPVYTNYIDKADKAVADQAIDDIEYAIALAKAEFTAEATYAVSGDVVTITFTGTDAAKAAEQVSGVVGGAYTPNATTFTKTIKNVAKGTWELSPTTTPPAADPED